MRKLHIVIVLSFVFSVVHAQNGMDSVKSRLTASIAKAMAQENITGASIALIENHAIVWAQGFGYTDTLKQQRVTAETLFGVGSVSKMFTAAGFMKAMQAGKISLDDRLTTVYPSFTIHNRFATGIGEITFRQLLSHHAGFPLETDRGGNYDNEDATLEQHVQSIQQGWLKSPVGQRYIYSNLDVDLTGYVLERIMHQPFAAYIRTAVFQPLGMNSSFFDAKEAIQQPNVATGYYYGSVAQTKKSSIIPSGTMFSNVIDLSHFVLMNLSGGMYRERNFLSGKLLREMTTVQFDHSDMGYGLGIAVQPYNDQVTLLNHSGSGRGYCSKIAWIPEWKIGVVVLCNADEVNFCERILDEAIQQLMIKQHTVPRSSTFFQKASLQPVVIDSLRLKQVAGRYKSFYTVENIVQTGNELWWVKNPRYKIKLDAVNDSVFYANDIRLVFHLRQNKDATVDYTSVKERDLWFLNDRPGEPRGQFDETWKNYTGKYVFSIYGQFSFLSQVTEQNGYLYISRSGGIKLSHYKDNLFLTPDGEMVVFDKDRMTFGGRPFKKDKP